MKKTIPFLMAFLFALKAFAQNDTITHWHLGVLPMKEGKVYYSKIVELPGTHQDEIYSRCKMWIVTNFRSANDVIQLDDKEHGKIISKGNTSVLYKYSSLVPAVATTINQLFDITIKEGKARLIITNIGLDYPGSGSIPIESWGINAKGKVMREANTTAFFENVDDNINSTLRSFKQYLKDPQLATNGTKDNW